MARTILCPHCKSTLNEDILKQRNSENVCLVCGGSLLVDDDNGTSSHNEELSFGEDIVLSENDSFDEDKIDFWWYEIDEPNVDRFVRGRVYTNCAKCGHFVGSVPYPVARTKDYLLIDSRISDKCGHCGNELKNHIISKRPENWVDPRKRDMWVSDYENIPKCPICSSTKIHKISLTNKAASAIVFGVFAAGHVSKTYQCDICGSKF